jgi:lipopolysaccharide export system permease protein
LFPIATLIGTMFALAQLVANSEFTVMRTSGMSVSHMALALLRVGLLFALLTFLFGEFIAPPAGRVAEQLRIKATSGVISTKEFRSGLWVKDETSFINVREMLPDTTLLGVKVYEFDEAYRLRSISFAKQGQFMGEGAWKLVEVTQTHFDGSRASVSETAEARWQSVLSPDLLNVLLVVPEKMSALNLYHYIHHLHDNRQKTTRYEIALWGKAAYPLAALVMMLIALPFSLRHARAGGISAKVFAGIMIGLGFHLLNRVFGHLGLLNDWPPAVSALFPTLVFLAVAVGMMTWMEKR